jgi:hypothetical protein
MVVVMGAVFDPPGPLAELDFTSHLAQYCQLVKRLRQHHCDSGLARFQNS